MTHTIIIFDPVEMNKKTLTVETQKIPEAIEQAKMFVWYDPADTKRTQYWQNILDRLVSLQKSL